MIPQPDDQTIRRAIEQSLLSPCRSKRGAVIFGERVVSWGYNHKTRFACDGSLECKATCRTDAIHAEQMAILMAGSRAGGCDLLHVKTVDGALVASGGPSCVECSKLALATGIAGVWLYHAEGWKRYPIDEFHELSLAALRASSVVEEGHQPKRTTLDAIAAEFDAEVAALREAAPSALSVEQAVFSAFPDFVDAFVADPIQNQAAHLRLKVLVDAARAARRAAAPVSPPWQELVDSVRIFLAQWQVVRPVLDGQAVLASVHGMPYHGPTIGHEIERLQRALVALPARVP